MSSQSHNHPGHHTKTGRNLHKDWRVWVGIILMLGAMAMYVLTLDDSTIPRLLGR